MILHVPFLIEGEFRKLYSFMQMHVHFCHRVSLFTEIFVFSLQQFAMCQTKRAAREQAQFESQILNLAHFRKL